MQRVLNEDDPLVHAEMLDKLAGITGDPYFSVEDLLKWSHHDGLLGPNVVISYSSIQRSPLIVDVSRTLRGIIKS